MSKPVANIDDESILSRRLVRYGLIWGVWTIVALFFSTQVYMMSYAERQPIRYAQGFLVQATACYLWALATPLVLWLSRRFRIDRSNWIRRVLVHLLLQSRAGQHAPCASFHCLHVPARPRRQHYAVQALQFYLLQSRSLVTLLLVHSPDEPCVQLLQQLSQR